MMSTRTAIEPTEEQTLLRYAQKTYYPVRIGELLNQRYCILAKLGFGAYSTVWLARDVRTSKYASVKVCVQDDSSTSPILNEVKTLRHLWESPQEHPGSAHVRLPDDTFEVDGPTGRHYCTATKPQGCNLVTLKSIYPEGRVPVDIVKHIIQRLIGAANWLCADCDTIHCEITTPNVLLQLSDEAGLQRIEQSELGSPNSPIDDNGYPIYPSRGDMISPAEVTCGPILIDFGSSRSSVTTNEGWHMPETHRAPEILLGLPWDSQIDVWSIGITTLELLEGRNIFYPVDEVNKQYVLPLALAQYISYMGLPPLSMIQQSKDPFIKSCFDESGNWIGEIPIPQASIENFITSMEPGEDRDAFLKFIKRILVWDPADRADTAELFLHEWFKPKEEGTENR